MCIKKVITAIFWLVLSSAVIAQDNIDIWEGIESMNGEHAKLYIYRADSTCDTHTSVIICPGGSYAHMCGMPGEGIKSAEWFSGHGITAFVLRYRTACRGYHHPAMIEDLQRAIQIVKENAGRYDINPDKVGIIGFSAGGHLVTMCNEFSNEDYLSPLGIDTEVSFKPAWVAAIYPVVSMQDSIAHRWSRKSLLGKNYTKEMQDRFSLELNVNESMSPMFIQASDDDHKVDVRNSIALANSLKDNNITYRFEHLKVGGHGYGMKDNKFAIESKWREKLMEWLKDINVL